MVIRSHYAGHAALLVGRTHSVGGLVALTVPGRLGLQGVWRWATIGATGALELRPGVNVLTGGRSPEGQLDAMLTWSL